MGDAWKAVGRYVSRYWPIAVGGFMMFVGFTYYIAGEITASHYAIFEMADDDRPDLPPVEFRGGAIVAVRFVHPDEMMRYCGLGAIACYDRKTAQITMPNPCRYVEEVQTYADLMCHELGHANGWKGTHEGGRFD